MSTIGGPEIITDNLVFMLDASNPKSYPGEGLSWVDLINSTSTGGNFPTYTGNSFHFNGIDNILYTGEWFTSQYFIENNSFTVTANVKIYSHDRGNEISGIFCNQRYRTEPNPGGFGMTLYAGKYGLNLGHEAEDGTTSSYEGNNNVLMPINYDVMENVTILFDNTSKTSKAYRNGSLEATKTNSNFKWSPRSSGLDARIGTNTQGGWGAKFEMEIASLMVYNKALSEEEISQNYNAVKSIIE